MTKEIHELLVLHYNMWNETVHAADQWAGTAAIRHVAESLAIMLKEPNIALTINDEGEAI